MAAQDFWNNLQTIKNTGSFNVTPKLPTPVAPPVNYQQIPRPVGGGNSGGELDRLLSAIRKQESGGDYGARNKDSGADGAYEIMPFNINGTRKGWDWEALGRDVDMNTFHNSPQIQDAIARYKLNKYLSRYGAAGAAVAWYGGEGSVKHMYDNKPQNGYPSLYAYWQSVLSKM